MNTQQEAIDAWFSEKGWPYWEPAHIMLRLSEEVGELARAVNHEYGPKKRKSTEGTQSIEEEIGDVLYTLACMANLLKIDLDTALQKSLTKVSVRDSERFSETPNV